MRRVAIGFAVVFVLLAVALAIAATQLPAIGAGALLFPSRRVTTSPPPAGCVDRTFSGVDVSLKGWQCTTTAPKRKGTVIYLHGIADNRGSAIGAIQVLLPLGFDVIAYDGRAHGESTGQRCTYGYFEKQDLQRVIDQAGAKTVILIGHSLGAAIALQAAAIEPRVRGVVAASTFSDLRTIAIERASYFPSWSIGPALERAERDGQFTVADVSPVNSAARIGVPVLLFHGANDRDTAPSHSERVFEALRQTKQLIVVPGASHNDVFNASTWAQIVGWLPSAS